mmetsp:Transcript_4481/g.4943  ORF Transcript_4481/g.4943 Transcript_4481/m.4943 type:complete len:274 (-) Transcript_4481:1647-2468(-)
MEDEGTEYSEIHRVLLTYIISVRYISHDELEPKFGTIVKKLNPDLLNNKRLQDLLQEHITSINGKVSSHGFKIDKIRHQVSGQLHYVLINTVSNEVIKGNTNYTVNELDTIKQIIDELVESSGIDFSIGVVNATQKVSSGLNKTMKEAGSMITKYIDDGWFGLTFNDRLILSIRSLSELKRYLIDRYGIIISETEGKIFSCYQCNEINTLGLRCPMAYCQINFHYKCLDIYMRNEANKGRCPNYSNCSYHWPGNELSNIDPKRIGIDPNLLYN